MSDSEIKLFKRWVQGMAAVMMLQLFGWIAIGVTDHFTLKAHEEKISEMKPRVDQLWWTHQKASDKTIVAETKKEQP